MSSDNKEVWISAYLFCPEPWEDLLLHGVYPFVKQGRQRGSVHQFFFIRYWENGPHIRLRIKCSVGDRKMVVHDVEEYFHRYFQTALSEAKMCCIEFMEYVPEIERYGGSEAIALAESQFELSSDTVLSVMASTPAWNYQIAMGAAIQIHLSFAFACRMDQEECVTFFQYVRGASNYIDPMYGVEVDRAFEKSFRDQKMYLIPYCQKLWDMLHEKRSFSEAWMTNWITGLENIHHQYSGTETDRTIGPNLFELGRTTHARFGIYGSFVHMTNNRLGILNRDEAYLAYLLVCCLSEMKINGR